MPRKITPDTLTAKTIDLHLALERSLHPDTLTLKNGVVTLRFSYYYRVNAPANDTIRDNIKWAIPGATIENIREVDRSWPKLSYVEATFILPLDFKLSAKTVEAWNASLTEERK